MLRLSKPILYLLFMVAILSTFTFIAGSDQSTPGFALILADTGEVLLTDNDVQAFHTNDNSLELNEAGIQKWNSHLKYPDIPKLNDTLFSQDFILKIDSKEICRGKFWSGLSSASYSGIIILDSLFKLDNINNFLLIKAEYPGINSPLDPDVSSALRNFFEKHNQLK